MVEQWLAMIQHRAGTDARVHVVATHGGPSSRVSAIDETRLRERFGELIAGFHDVDSKFPDTLPELKAAIATTAAGLRHTRRWYPASWQRVREDLGKSGEQSLSYEDYLEATQRNGLTEIGARSLAVNSHTLGYWIYYADEPALAQVVILKPDWLSVAIAAVLEDSEAAGSGGLVPHRTFGRIWSTPAPGSGFQYSHSQQEMLLRMMERFELTYRVPELEAGEPLSLVGQLVPSARPDLTEVWEEFRQGEPEGVEICQVVERGTDRPVRPEGLIYRLIVRLHRQSLDRAQAPEGAYWRGGLVVQNRYKARALIILTENGVRVQGRGPDQSGYVHQIADEIRDCVEGFWSGLMTIAKVPCGESCRLGTPGRGLFDVDKLMDARYKHGQKKFPCPASGCEEWPSIDDLLGSVSTGTAEADRLEAIQTGLEEVAARQAAGTQRVLASIDDFRDDVKASFAANAAKLDEILGLQNDEAKDGPRLFTLAPMERTLLHPGWTTRRMQLTLYCEYSRLPVHALDPHHPEAGIYAIDVPKDWWVKALPLLKVTSALLKPFLGISLAVAELDYSDSEWRAVRKQLALAKETLNAAADAADAADATEANSDSWGMDSDPGGGVGITSAEGSVLRTLHQMLKEKDSTFADLRRVHDQGRFLWVHPKFVPRFQLPPPVIPI